MFQRFLLAVDASPSSEIAVDFATALSRKCDSSVHVFHVNEFLISGQGVTLLSRDEATTLISGTVEQLREAGVQASGSVEVASYRQVPRRIADGALEREVDAIIVGSSRHRNLKRLISPRVRERTIRLTDLPILTAPSPLEVSKRNVSSTFTLDASIEELGRVLAVTKHER